MRSLKPKTKNTKKQPTLRVAVATLRGSVATLQVAVATLQVAVATLQVAVARLEKAVAKLAADFVAQNERNFQYFASKEELREVRENMMTKEDGRIMKNEIMTILDAMNKTLLTLATEATANVGAHERFDERLNSHEYRLKRLESHFRFPLPGVA